MNKIERVEAYKAFIAKDILTKWNGFVRVWSEPKSAVEGSGVVDEISEPVEVTVVEEQKGMYGSDVQRAKVKYGDKDGWVLYHMIEKA